VSATGTHRRPSRPAPPALGPRQRRAAAYGLVLAMALGSMMMWIGLPLGFLYVGSLVQGGAQPTLTAFAVVLFGIIIGAWVIGRGLAWLDRMFALVSGVDPNDHRIPLPWLRSMRGERGPLRERTVLDMVMLISVAVGLVIVGLLFVLVHPGTPTV
jgi:hypothetical protein